MYTILHITIYIYIYNIYMYIYVYVYIYIYIYIYTHSFVVAYVLLRLQDGLNDDDDKLMHKVVLHLAGNAQPQACLVEDKGTQ